MKESRDNIKNRRWCALGLLVAAAPSIQCVQHEVVEGKLVRLDVGSALEGTPLIAVVSLQNRGDVACVVQSYKLVYAAGSWLFSGSKVCRSTQAAVPPHGTSETTCVLTHLANENMWSGAGITKENTTVVDILASCQQDAAPQRGGFPSVPRATLRAP